MWPQSAGQIRQNRNHTSNFFKKIKDLKKANIEIKWSTLKLLGHGKTTSKVTQKLLCSHTVIFNGVYVQTAPKISPVLLLGQDFFN